MNQFIMDYDDEKYMQRSFGHLKNKTLGVISSNGIFKILLSVAVALSLVIFILFHPIYLKTGVPMFKYGASMMLLPPFYALWAIFKLVTVYLLGKQP